MIAIHTKYLGPTNSKGSRIKASVSRAPGVVWSVTVGYDHAADDPFGNGNVYALEG